MSNARVQLLSEQWTPLAHTAVEAYDLTDYTSIVETAQTDANGIAEFLKAQAQTSGFRAKLTRFSGKSGSVGHTGVVHLILLPEAS